MDSTCQECGEHVSTEAANCPSCGAGFAVAADDVSKTIVRPTRSQTGQPSAVLSDGRRVPLQHRLLIGRNPRQEDGAQSLSVADPDYTVSKTHVQVAIDGDAIWVTDLLSTNGVHMSLPAGSEQWLTPGEPARVWPGTRVHFGSQSFVVESGSSAASAPSPERAPAPTDPPASVASSSLIAAVPMPGTSVSTGDLPVVAPLGQPQGPTGMPSPKPMEPLPQPEFEDESPAYCVHCGAELLQGASFCVACGQSLTALAAPLPAPAASAAEGLVVGNIRVSAGQVITPIGSAPLRGSVWNLNEQVTERTYIAQSTIIWAIVLSAFCGLGLLLLLKKEHEVTGTATVSVTSGHLQYSTTLGITSSEHLAATRSQVASAQAAAQA